MSKAWTSPFIERVRAWLSAWKKRGEEIAEIPQLRPLGVWEGIVERAKDAVKQEAEKKLKQWGCQGQTFVAYQGRLFDPKIPFLRKEEALWEEEKSPSHRRHPRLKVP